LSIRLLILHFKSLINDYKQILWDYQQNLLLFYIDLFFKFLIFTLSPQKVRPQKENSAGGLDA